MIFEDGNPDLGLLTHEALNVCKLLAVNPDDLVERDINQFKKPGFSK